MRRRDMLAATGAAIAIALVPGIAEARTIGISGVSVSPAQPPAGSDAFGRVKGVLSFTVTASPPLAASSPYRGIESWGNNGGDGHYQCVDLIRRYAQKLEFNGYQLPLRFDQLPSLGNGQDAASQFAQRSGGSFRFVNGAGAAALPRLGAVVSIRGWTAVPEGHTGIVQRVAPSTNSAVVTLFDQNFPSPQWKTLEFTRTNGVWSGVLVNQPASGNVTRNPVVGWADPTA